VRWSQALEEHDASKDSAERKLVKVGERMPADHRSDPFHRLRSGVSRFELAPNNELPEGAAVQRKGQQHAATNSGSRDAAVERWEGEPAEEERRHEPSGLIPRDVGAERVAISAMERPCEALTHAQHEQQRQPHATRLSKLCDAPRAHLQQK